MNSFCPELTPVYDWVFPVALRNCVNLERVKPNYIALSSKEAWMLPSFESGVCFIAIVMLDHRLNIKTVFPGLWIPVLKIRRAWDLRIITMWFPMLIRRRLYIEMFPWLLYSHFCTPITDATSWLFKRRFIVIWTKMCFSQRIIGFAISNYDKWN